ncbi:hypothetical protein AAHA92_05039 [Salvia divinorum]|uniref:Uncharacterized protein n=1 Tax=Salvia divinorum TaxID=28513 RepID=A0ABD1I4N9_SALDI
MKKSCAIATYVAASASAISSASSPKVYFPHEDDRAKKNSEKSAPQGSSSSEKFAPRFDGLRFIETLVTAHR